MTTFEKIKGMNEKEMARFIEDLFDYGMNYVLTELKWSAEDGNAEAREMLDDANTPDSKMIKFWLSKKWEGENYGDDEL